MMVKDNEILFIYNPTSIKDREALAYANSLKHYKVKEYDVTKQVPTKRQLAELSEKLGVGIHSLVNHKSETYIEKYQHADLDRDDLLKAIVKSPSIIKTPIAEFKNTAEFVDSTYEFIKKDMKNK
ncbi:arsenate reductase family protein [Fulvivirga lutea]|uniref:Arsenate reductase n=1 Tax=Fulvivirga lutea TaxID=2810512 RepID=A0A974ZZM2_9BACT|nr:hypothetical protein [Fulvivirga lutea]QSE95891.1 hypothetical protein JR347_09685 [Fulvivirga lutea]